MIKRIRKRYSKNQVLELMLPLVREWFGSKFDELTDPQAYAIPVIHARKNVLISSPTGSGKTLTAFLSIINELMIKQEKGELEDKIYCVYISPLKALANDIEKNLLSPLKELGELAGERGLEKPGITVAVRSGDTTSYERQKMARKPPHILITTPESLAIILTTPKFSQSLHSAEWIIVDEIHEVCSSKRGVMLSVNLERLQNRIEGKASRIGLSATQAPIEEMAKFLVGYEGRKQRDVNIVEVKTGKKVELEVVTPVEDMTALPFEIINARMYVKLKGTIDEHTTTLVFTNTRSGTEAVMVRLGELGLEDIAAHHGSLSRETRLDVENRLKNGRLKAVVSSTSLELGIDIGSIDMMCQIGSPKSIAKGLQRVGRAGHGVGEVSRGKLIAFDNDDLMECAVLAKKASENYIDRVDLPRNSLDVLSQTIVGLSLEDRCDVDAAFKLIKNSHSFRTLEKDDLLAVIHYLSSRDMPHVYSKIWYDEDENVFGRKKGSRLIYYLNSGTIPEEANYKVYSDAGGRLGELSEGFAERLSQGDVFVLGGSAYEFIRSRGMSLYVRPAVGRRPTVPSWTGEMLPRSFDLSVEIGRFRGEMARKVEKNQDLESWLLKNYPIDRGGARTIQSYIHEQLAFNGNVPTDKELVIEGYVDPKGNLNIVFHYCFGRRTNDALARAYAMAVSNKHNCNVSVSVTDDCFMLTVPKRIGLKGLEKLVTSKNVIGLLDEALRETELFKHRFRHVSTRGFAVLRNYKGREISVGRQFQRSQKVLRVLGKQHGFPIVKETMNEIMNINMNLDGALTVLNGIGKGDIRVSHAGITDVPSPFAHNVVLVGMSDIVLMHDRSALLKELHRKVLMRVGGEDALRPEFELEDVRQHFGSKRPSAVEKDDIPRLLEEVGPLELFTRRGRSVYEFSQLDEETVARWCNELIESGDVISVWAGRSTWAAREELADYAAAFSTDQKVEKEERKTLDALGRSKDPISTLALSKKVGGEPKEVRRILGILERGYLVGRMGTNNKGNTLWIARKQSRSKASGNFERRLVERHLTYFAPLTDDEIAFDLGLPKDAVIDVLNRLEQGGVAASGAFTEQGLQYMLARDLAALKGQSTEGLITSEQMRALHLRKHFGEFRTMDDYFERYGVVWLPQELMARTGKKGYRQWLAGRKKGGILHGRFLDGGVCFVRRKDANTYVDAYRTEVPNEAEYRILDIIVRNPGIDSASIAKEMDLPVSKTKPLIDRLDRNMFIVRGFVDREGWSTYNRYEALEIDHNPENRGAAAERVILQTARAFSPISLRSLAYATGFSSNRVRTVTEKAVRDGAFKEVRTSDGGLGNLLVTAEEFDDLRGMGMSAGAPKRRGLSAGKSMVPDRSTDDKVRILTLYDPLVQPQRYELRRRFGDAWYYPIFKGAKPVGMMEMWEMSGCIEVREIALDDVSLLPDFLKALDRFSEFYRLNFMEVIRATGALGKPVTELDPDIIKVFTAHGYVRQNDWLLKGDLAYFTVSETQFLSYLLWKQRVAPGRQFDSMTEGLEVMGGFRSDDEAGLRCGRTVALKKLHRTGIVQYGRLFPLLLTYALPDHIALCKAARGVKPDKNMKILIHMFAEEGALKWRDVVDKSPLGYHSTLDAKNRLTAALLIIWNAKRQFELAPDSPYSREYARKEIIRKTFEQFGVFSAEQLAYYLRNEYRMGELRRLLQELEEEGFLAKGYILEGSGRLHWFVKGDEEQMRKVPAKFDAVLPSMDRLAFYLVPQVAQKLKMGSSWIMIRNGEIIGAASARGKRTDIRVLRFEGSQDAWELLKDYCASNGIRMKKEFAAREEEEDYQEWYEKHLRPSD
jgi:ATP-dependent Lhr-like helicase